MYNIIRHDSRALQKHHFKTPKCEKCYFYSIIKKNSCEIPV